MSTFLEYIIWIVGLPFVLGFIGAKLLKRRAWIIFLIEGIIFIFLNWISIIDNRPIGTTSQQFKSYFGNIQSDIYIKYIPFILFTVVFMVFFKKKSNKTSKV